MKAKGLIVGGLISLVAGCGPGYSAKVVDGCNLEVDGLKHELLTVRIDYQEKGLGTSSAAYDTTGDEKPEIQMTWSDISEFPGVRERIDNYALHLKSIPVRIDHREELVKGKTVHHLYSEDNGYSVQWVDGNVWFSLESFEEIDWKVLSAYIDNAMELRDGANEKMNSISDPLRDLFNAFGNKK